MHVVLVSVSLHTEFEMLSFTHCKDMIGAPKFKMGHVTLTKIPTHMMNREIIPGRKKEGSTVSSINCDRCRHLDLPVSSLPAAPA